MASKASFSLCVLFACCFDVESLLSHREGRRRGEREREREKGRPTVCDKGPSPSMTSDEGLCSRERMSGMTKSTGQEDGDSTGLRYNDCLISLSSMPRRAKRRKKNTMPHISWPELSLTDCDGSWDTGWVVNSVIIIVNIFLFWQEPRLCKWVA